MVVHLAAETDVERCEAEREHASRTNADGTRLVALACRGASVPLAYVSTAGVFDGEQAEPYTEEDAPRPINHYGWTKLEGEREVQSLVERHYVVRAGWMVGGGDRDHKFVAKILAQLRAGADTIYAVGDRWGTPTYAPDFARCFARLVREGPVGLYHMACLGRGTRYHVAEQILLALGLDQSIRLVEVDSEFFREAFPAPRPRSEMMHNAALDRLGLNSMRPWQESLHEYLRTTFHELQALTPGGAA
jgi:dTDP-4-dehydrorhamnose reductase